MKTEATKPVGRPKASDPKGSSVTTWIGKAEHDQLIRLANQHETSVSSLVRSLLMLKLPK